MTDYSKYRGVPVAILIPTLLLWTQLVGAYGIVSPVSLDSGPALFAAAIPSSLPLAPTPPPEIEEQHPDVEASVVATRLWDHGPSSRRLSNWDRARNGYSLGVYRPPRISSIQL